MDSDKFTKRLQLLEDRNAVSDGAGGFEGSLDASSTDNYTIVTTTWANIAPMKGRRSLEYQKIVNGYPNMITINYRDDLVTRFTASAEISEEYLFRYTDKAGRQHDYKPHSLINVDEENWFIEILAVEQK